MLKGFFPHFLIGLAAVRIAAAQNVPDIQKVLDRLDRLEEQNRKLMDEIHALRGELGILKNPAVEDTAAAPSPPQATLAERIEVQEGRTAEMAQSKVESSQRMPVSLTGMMLFNAFHNGRHSGTAEYPVLAGFSQNPSSSGATLRQTVLGLTFNGPELPGGGKVSGTFYMDFFSGTTEPGNNLMHIRIATLDFKWKNTTFMVGQDKPIIAPREPTSLAQVGVSPLTAAGNLWDWQPQARVEQRFRIDSQSGLRVQAGIYETSETEARVPASLASTLENVRPGYEGRVEYFIGSETRRFEIAPAVHFSTTHVAGVSVPSHIAAFDWRIKPVAWADFTGAWFKGENAANLGALRQGFTVLSTGAVIPVHTIGGWGQLALIPTSRLSFHIYGGEQANRTSDIASGVVARNFVYAGNVMFRIAPNVLGAFELSQARTTYLNNGIRLNNHYDLAIAYQF